MQCFLVFLQPNKSNYLLCRACVRCALRQQCEFERHAVDPVHTVYSNSCVHILVD